MEEHLKDLNPAQKSAVLSTDGPLLVVAGAGAGKTKTLTHRIIHLMHLGIPASKILAVTFTNKAAAEMRERILSLSEKMFGGFTERPTISTFHSLGVQILRQFGDKVGLSKNFSIMDSDDTQKLVKESVIELGFDPKQLDPKLVRHIISKEKGEGVEAEEFQGRAESAKQEVIGQVWVKYEQKLREEKAVDFDDLLVKTAELLRKNKDVLEHFQDRWSHIHIDEYQDTNKIQYEIANLLARKNKNICVVGDGDQSIYGWRGATVRNILEFEHDYPDATVVLLEENYRSTATILEAANTVISKNIFRKDKNLFTKKDRGETIKVYNAYNENDEATYVAEAIVELIDQGTDPSDIAVLYRANFQSRVLEEALLSYRIPYQVVGTKFFERKEIKDVLAYLRASLVRESLTDIKRIINIPARGIGKTTVVKLFSNKMSELPENTRKKIEGFYKLLDEIKEFSESNPLSETIVYLLKKSGLEDNLRAGGSDDLERLENIYELVTIAKRYDEFDNGVEKLLEDSALISDQDTLMDAKDGVRLMTVHAGKGLEWKDVFIVGLEQGLFPHERTKHEKPEDAEEERRLFYVALTRGREHLHLSWAMMRTMFGQRQVNMPSEFLSDIPEELKEDIAPRNGEGLIKTFFID